MNVLIYSGPGTSGLSVRAALRSLNALLTPHYSVSTIDAKSIIEDPWHASTALLVIPGGRDLPYCRELDGRGNTRIQEYVRRGGSYLGLCAGAYYASSRVEFELDTPIAVQGPRELKFYGNTARGCAFSGFVYDSEVGAKAVRLETASGQVKCYWNGGGIFVDAKPSETLARYVDSVKIDGGRVAVVETKVGKGTVILSAVHIEVAHDIFDDRQPSPEVIEELRSGHEGRMTLFRDVLTRLGLTISDSSAPELSVLHVVAKDEQQKTFIMNRLIDMSIDSTITAEHDTFRIIAAPDDREKSELPYERQVKYITGHPVNSTFSLPLYFSRLKTDRFGSSMLFGDTVTSSQTLLDKNFSLQRVLPNGFTILCLRQVSGRGRGSNAWVSPPGVLSFSMILHHTPRTAHHEGLIFLQYLISLSVVHAVKVLASVDVRIKWPNDIYMAAEDGVQINGKKYAKISGSLITTTWWQDKYIMVVGVGINVSNPHPTTSVNATLKDKIQPEILLAQIMNTFELFYQYFEESGFTPFLSKYYENWLHTNQVVTIEATEQKGTITGIDPKYGTLIVTINEGVDRGREVRLQADGNSFDMMRNLILVKNK